MNSKRLAAAGLSCTGATIGSWAELAPRSFYESFPWPGRHWITLTGAFNEHLVRDVGGLYLALTVVSAWAALKTSREITRVTGAAWSMFSVPHLAFHADHLDEFGTADQLGNLTTLGIVAVLGLVLLAPDRQARDGREARRTDDRQGASA